VTHLVVIANILFDRISSIGEWIDIGGDEREVVRVIHYANFWTDCPVATIYVKD